ncbi:MAG TPA: tetratricopeptide repeat protein [Phnomibacter sp.]|nr:tetratricopeptide repeat protein [Phnomibacter sp.]
MAEKKDVQFEEVQATDPGNKVVDRAKGFWEQYSRSIIYVGALIILLFGGYFVYQNFYKEPREAKAADAIFHAQRYFAQDSLNLALNGDGQHAGFEKVANSYSGTKAGNLAKFYAGICALQLGDPTKAVKHLNGFSTDAREIQTIAYARLADAYADLGKNDDALKFYEKAAYHYPEHDGLSADNLFRAGMLAESMGKEDKAASYYQEIKKKYPRTDKGYQIDKYLARVGVAD